jgi:hypothetical protein
MVRFQESNVVNSIHQVTEGEHQGKLRINVATSLVGSRDIIASQGNLRAKFAGAAAGSEETDLDANVVAATDYLDLSNGETMELGEFLLPAEAWKDTNLLDWVLSNKTGSSTDDLFSDLMLQEYTRKSENSITLAQYELFRTTGGGQVKAN